MNCLYEAAATVFLRVRGNFVPPVDDGLCEAEEELMRCRAKLQPREKDYAKTCDRLWAEAMEKTRKGDRDGAAALLKERSAPKRQRDKLRGALSLIDKELEAMQSSELDKEILNSLKVSNAALKKAGKGVKLEEAQSLMNHLEDRVDSASGLTELLSTPMPTGAVGVDGDALDLELEAELGLLEDACTAGVRATDPLLLPPVPVSRMAVAGERSPRGGGVGELAKWE